MDDRSRSRRSPYAQAGVTAGNEPAVPDRTTGSQENHIKMNKTYHTAAILLATLCTSCLLIEEPVEPDNRLMIEIAGSGMETETKAPILTTVFQDAAALSVFLDDGDGNYDGRNYNNIKFSKSAGASSPFALASDILLSATSGTLYGYYPYSSSITSAASIPMDVATQTDYMYATAVSGLTMKNRNATLQMKHAMCCVRLVFSKGSYGGAGNVTQVSIASDGLAKTGTLNARNGAVSSLTGAGTAYVSTTSFTLPASGTVTKDYLMIPTGTAAPVTISCVIDGKTYTIQTSSVTMTPGKILSYEVSPGVVPVSISHNGGDVITVWSKKWTGKSLAITTANTSNFTVTMSDGTTKTVNRARVTYSSSNPDVIAAASATMNLGIHSYGTATITASYTSGGVTVSCDIEVRANEIELTAPKTELNAEGTTATVTVKDHSGTAVSSPTITWTTSDNTRITLYNPGLPTTQRKIYTGTSKGEASVTAAYEGDLGSASVSLGFNAVKVVATVQFRSSTSVSVLSGGTVSPAPYAVGSFMGTVITSDPADFVWDSSDESVATVENGVVTGHNVGTSTITCSYDGVASSNSVKVTVVTQRPDDYYIGLYNNPSISVPNQTMTTGNTLELRLWKTKWTLSGYGFVPSYEDISSSATWSSSNTSSATVDATGKVTAVKYGTATITATYGGTDYICTVTVSPVVTYQLKLSTTSLDLHKGRTGTVKVTYRTLEDGTITSSTDVTSSATYSSSSSTVASASSGTVTAKTAGSTTITVSYGGQSATLAVKVTEYSLVINPSSITLITQRTQGLTAGLNMNDGRTTGTKIVTANTSWTITSGSSYVSLTDNYLLGLAAGTATIQASYTLDGITYTATATVTVEEPVPVSIELSEADVPLMITGSYMGNAFFTYPTKIVTATVTMNDGSRKITPDITWSTSNASVATVSDGVVEAVAAGKTVLKASYTSNDVTVSESIDIYVSHLYIRFTGIISMSEIVTMNKSSSLQAYVQYKNYNATAYTNVTASCSFSVSTSGVIDYKIMGSVTSAYLAVSGTAAGSAHLIVSFGATGPHPPTTFMVPFKVV